MRCIILRFDSNDELILAIDKVAGKLKNTNAGVTKLALYEFCQRILDENGKSTEKQSR